MDFPSEGGAIKAMLPLDDFMEVYAAHATYRVRSPDNLDPERSVSNMPWSTSTAARVGASNPIVARIVIQSVEALGTWRPRNGDPRVIKRHLHACKEEALVCEAAYNRLKTRYDAIVADVTEAGLKMQHNVIECPSIPSLRDEAAAFLTSAKRALQLIGEVFNQFYVPDGRTPMVANANFEFAITRLENSVPVNREFIDYLREVVPTAKRFVDLRNGLEHPTADKSTVVEDFRLIPIGIIPPSWHRSVLAKEAYVIDDMQDFLSFVVEFCESVFFFGLIDNLPANLPFRLDVQAVPEDEIDRECPVAYRLRAY